MGLHDPPSLLRALGASPWLLRHHELVVEAGGQLLAALPSSWLSRVDREAVLFGCGTHDAGKIVETAEAHGPGHRHEAAGRELLVAHGIPEHLARFCVTHARWDDSTPAEDLLVALADKLWKGARIPELEALAVTRFATDNGLAAWQAFEVLDAACERVARGADRRLARSRG